MSSPEVITADTATGKSVDSDVTVTGGDKDTATLDPANGTTASTNETTASVESAAHVAPHKGKSRASVSQPPIKASSSDAATKQPTESDTTKASSASRRLQKYAEAASVDDKTAKVRTLLASVRTDDELTEGRALSSAFNRSVHKNRKGAKMIKSLVAVSELLSECPPSVDKESMRTAFENGESKV